MPPEELVAWTEYLALLAGAIAAVRGIWKGGDALHFKADQIRRNIAGGQSASG